MLKDPSTVDTTRLFFVISIKTMSCDVHSLANPPPLAPMPQKHLPIVEAMLATHRPYCWNVLASLGDGTVGVLPFIRWIA